MNMVASLVGGKNRSAARRRSCAPAIGCPCAFPITVHQPSQPGGFNIEPRTATGSCEPAAEATFTVYTQQLFEAQEEPLEEDTIIHLTGWVPQQEPLSGSSCGCCAIPPSPSRRGNRHLATVPGAAGGLSRGGGESTLGGGGGIQGSTRQECLQRHSANSWFVALTHTHGDQLTCLGSAWSQAQHVRSV